MNGKILHFRQNRHTTSGNHLLIAVEGVSTRAEAEKLIDKTVVYDTGKNQITGRVAAPHGNKGVVRAVFTRGLPGQSITETVTIN